MMKHFPSLFLVFAALSFMAGCQSSSNSEENTISRPPNIVLILADDLGYGGISSFGNDSIETPHLDAMAKAGLRFTDFHSNAPVCTPTRAALLTGRYQQRCGLEGVIYVRGETRQTGMDTSVVTIAEALKQQGYATGVTGKWHLGYQKEFFPANHGFDEFYGYASGNVDYHTHYDNAGIYDWWHNTDSIQEEGYVTDLITQHAIEFIEQHQDQPFFLYVAHEAPHVPFQGRNDPGYRFANNEFSYWGPVEDRARAYREMVEVMDEGVGDIMAKLKTLGLEENTLVIFTSDNGAIPTYGDNGGLRGDKTTLWEGGHRVPAIAYWKGRIQPNTTDQLALTYDLMPTFLTLAGLEDVGSLQLDGRDISPTLLKNEALPERTVHWRYRNQKAIRQGPWKLMVTEQDTALYNLDTDLTETTDVSSSNAVLYSTLLNGLEEWEADLPSGDELRTW